VKISCKKKVHICRTNFAKKKEWNLHETTSQWKTYGKQLFSEDFEVQDVSIEFCYLGRLELSWISTICYHSVHLAFLQAKWHGEGDLHSMRFH
jgi:hypothetical protein